MALENNIVEGVSAEMADRDNMRMLSETHWGGINYNSPYILLLRAVGYIVRKVRG